MAFFMLSIFVLPVSAESNETFTQKTINNSDGSTVVYFSDGSKLHISAATKAETPYAICTTTPTYYRKVSYSDSDDVLQWDYELSATFSYVYGKSSTCINTSYTHNIYESDWTFSDGAATKSGNTAIGNGLFKLKFFFVTVHSYTIDISLSCDIYGNIT